MFDFGVLLICAVICGASMVIDVRLSTTERAPQQITGEVRRQVRWHAAAVCSLAAVFLAFLPEFIGQFLGLEAAEPYVTGSIHWFLAGLYATMALLLLYRARSERFSTSTT